MKKNNDEKLSSLRNISSKFKIINIFRYIFYYLDGLFLIFAPKKTYKKEKQQVLIIANLGLGDAVNFLSVTDKYRKFYSKDKFEISLIVPNGIDKLFKEETEFDNIIGINFNECVFNIFKRYKLFNNIIKNKYDILIDGMGISGTSMNMYMSRIINARKKITIVNEAVSICPKFFINKIYTDIFYVNNLKLSNIELYNNLYEFITGNKKNIIRFHKTKDYDISSYKLPKKYYIVFPSASANIKKWDYEKYATIIKKIYNKIKIPVLFCGTLQDLESVNEVIKLIDVPYINIIGKTNVLEFIQIIKKSSFVITNDTSSYHIAINEEVPVAIITGGYTYDGYVTYNFKNNNYKKPYIIVSNRDCFNCYFKCPYLTKNDKWPCLNDISVDYAWKKIENMIEENYEK